MNRINLICLGVRDIAKSLAFYKHIVFQTFTKNDKLPFVFFNNQGTKLELYPIDLLTQDIDEKNPPPISTDSFGGITLAINMKSEQEIDHLMGLVTEHGERSLNSRRSSVGVVTADTSKTRMVIIGKSPTAPTGNSTKTICSSLMRWMFKINNCSDKKLQSNLQFYVLHKKISLRVTVEEINFRVLLKLD